jgi:hypothetical protein
MSHRRALAHSPRRRAKSSGRPATIDVRAAVARVADAVEEIVEELGLGPKECPRIMKAISRREGLHYLVGLAVRLELAKRQGQAPGRRPPGSTPAGGAT